MKALFLKFNRWIRGNEGNETALHFLICAFVMFFIINLCKIIGFNLHIIPQLFLPFAIGYLWEYAGNQLEGKKIDKWDIIKTIAGGYVAVMLEYFA